MQYGAVIFDLDGTLADTISDIAEAANRGLDALDLPGHPEEAYRTFVGNGARRMVERALPPDRPDLIERLLGLFRRYYGEQPCNWTRPYNGVPEVLRGLEARGVPAAVLSNKPDEFTQTIVSRLFPLYPFAAVSGHRRSAPLKPDPSSALAMAAAIGVEPERCLFVGDGIPDMRTAVAAGMTPLGVRWGYTDPSELLSHGAAALLSNPEEILLVFDAKG